MPPAHRFLAVVPRQFVSWQWFFDDRFFAVVPDSFGSLVVVKSSDVRQWCQPHGSGSGIRHEESDCGFSHESLVFGCGFSHMCFDDGVSGNSGWCMAQRKRC